MDVLKELVSRVARAFYEPKHIVILDGLNNAPPNAMGIREDDLALSLKIPLRDIHKLCGTLREDRLLKMQSMQDTKKQDQRPLQKTYYYLDYKEFVDVVKWKMYKMRTEVQEKLKTESENKGFVCRDCTKQFTSLDVMSLIDPLTGLFNCDVCEHVLEENNNAEKVRASEKVLSLLQEQTMPIISLLKKTDSIVIPDSHVFKPGTAGAQVTGTSKDDHELAVAQNTGAGQGDIIVDLQMDNEAARRAKQAEAEEKRQQNALPVWHQRSTVSDGWLGTGDRPETDGGDHEDADQFEEVATDEVDADTQDYYAKYYESLSQNPLTETGEDFDAAEDEFETIVNENGKREFSHEEDGYEEDEAYKHLRTDSEEPGDEFADGDEDIPLVSVNGNMVPLNEVMEEDQKNMTTEEYKAYYDAYQAWQES